MGHIPSNAKWFIAQLVEEFRVQGCKGNAVHINYLLIEASTPVEAYRKAMELGKQVNCEYENPQGKMVTHRFVGLHDLDVVPFPLEHGSELMYVERLGLSRAALQKLVRKKRDLEAFRPIPFRHPRGRPDYSSREIMDMVAGKLSRTKQTEKRRFTKRGRAASVANSNVTSHPRRRTDR